MSTAKDTYALLKYFIQRHRTPVVEYDRFARFVRMYAEKYHKDRPSLGVFLQQDDEPLDAQLREFEAERILVLRGETDGARTIVFAPCFRDAVKDAYRKAESRPDLPFPSEETFRTRIPDELVSSVDVQTDFIETLQECGKSPGTIYRLRFPGDIQPMVVTGDLLGRKLLELSVHRIRQYLHVQRNADYLRQKLLSVFSTRHLMTKDMIDSILIKPGSVTSELLKPNEFTFAFWTHLTSFLLGEYRDKTGKLPEEHGYCQAAHLIGFYVMFYKGKAQKEHRAAAALKSLGFRLKKAPYAYRPTDIYTIKDEKGIPLLSKCSQEKVDAWVEERARSADGEHLPMLLKLKPVGDSAFYVHKEGVVPLLMRQVTEAGQKLRDQYMGEWVAELRQHRKSDIMLKDDAFLADLSERAKKDFPTLQVLLNDELLARVRHEGVFDRVLAGEFRGLFGEKGGLKPLNEILGLQRAELYNHAGLHLSFWEILPRWKTVVEFFRRVLRIGSRREAAAPSDAAAVSHISSLAAVSPGAAHGRPAVSDAAENRPEPVLAGKVIETEGESGRQTARQRSVQYRRALRRLREDLVGPETNLDEGLASLAEKWNPLYDPRAKSNLVEDVNSMIRDFIRRMKDGFRVKPPDRERIRNMADMLASNAAFDRIRKKDAFRTYIMLYMLKLLGDR